MMALDSLAGITAQMGRTAQAEEIYREVFAARKRVLGESHPSTLATSRALNAILTAQTGATDPHVPAARADP
jgi:hypothetical protein